VHGPFRGLPLIDDRDGIAGVRAEDAAGDGGPAEGRNGEHGRQQQRAAASPAAVGPHGGDLGLGGLGAEFLQHDPLGGAGVPGGGQPLIGDRRFLAQPAQRLVSADSTAHRASVLSSRASARALKRSFPSRWAWSGMDVNWVELDGLGRGPWCLSSPSSLARRRRARCNRTLIVARLQPSIVAI
jgi:hypothetical protein